MRSRRRLAAAAALAALAAGTAGGIAVSLWEGEPERPLVDPRVPLTATASIAPRVSGFGDRVLARVRVAVDPRRVDPATVEVSARYAPWRPVGAPAVTRRSAGAVSVVEHVVELVCFGVGCAPSGGRARYDLPPATVSYGSRPARASRDVAWPAFEVASRLDVEDSLSVSSGTEFLRTQWRAVDTLPAATTRWPAGLVAAVVAGAGAALLGAGAVVLLAALGRPVVRLRRRRPEPTPVERALLLLRGAHAAEAAERRRALETLAVEAARRGEPELEQDARALAWAKVPPPPDDAVALGDRARHLLSARNGRRWR